MLALPVASFLFGGQVARWVVARWSPVAQHAPAEAKREFIVQSVGSGSPAPLRPEPRGVEHPVAASGGAAPETPGAMSEEARRRLIQAASYSVTGPAHEQWEHETKDFAWALDFERGVRTLFDAPELLGAQLVNVDCRTTLCRIEVTFNSMDAFQRLVLVSAKREPLIGTTGISDVQSSRAVSYVTRSPAG
jgi:hypothetical protein